VTEIRRWEKAHLDEVESRDAVKAVMAKYEDALRAKLFGF
jgi:hypothetical protein